MTPLWRLMTRVVSLIITNNTSIIFQSIGYSFDLMGILFCDIFVVWSICQIIKSLNNEFNKQINWFISISIDIKNVLNDNFCGIINRFCFYFRTNCLIFQNHKKLKSMLRIMLWIYDISNKCCWITI